MTKFNRRNFLLGLTKYGGVGIVLNTFLDNMIFGLIKNAMASEAQEMENYYLGIYIQGGLPRWMFDLTLYRDSTEQAYLSDLYNPMAITSWTNNNTTSSGGGSLTSEYSLDRVSGLLLPPLWNSDVNDLASLASNMIVVRDIENLSIHPAWTKMFVPRDGQPGMHGITPMHNTSTAPIPNIILGIDQLDLNIPSNATPLYAKSVNPGNSMGSSNNYRSIAESVVDPFVSSDVVNLNEVINQKVEESLIKLKTIGDRWNVNSKEMHQTLSEARSLFRMGLENLLDEFETKFDEYQNIFSQAMNKEITGVDDASIYPCSTPDTKESSLTTSNMFATFNNNGVDLLSYIRDGEGGTAYNDNLSAGLALTEITFGLETNGSSYPALTNSVLFQAGNMRLANGTTLTNDPHNVGAVPTTLFYTKYFQGLAHCIQHFITNIGPGKFEKTVIHLGSEFSRSARYVGSGSDHGGEAGIATIFTGNTSVNKGKIIGDLDYEGANSNATYQGMWGQGKNGWGPDVVFNLIEHIFGVPEDDRTYGDKTEAIEELGKSTVRLVESKNFGSRRFKK